MLCVNECHGDDFSAYLGDCVEIMPQLPSASVGFSIHSPPFSNLFVYSDSERDLGNCASDEEFFRHYSFVVRHLLRVTKPGRLAAVHCSELPLQKWKDGEIGLKDFPGMIVRCYQEAGWVFHSRITVWRDPVVEVTRTKALGLLYKQLKKDSTRSRVGMPDYVLVFRAPGENAEPVGQDEELFPVERWQQWASPVWMDIRQTNTLNIQGTRDNADERHICPLQLDLIERALLLWSNRGDVVLSPFAGLGSEGYVALKLKRRFVGVELEPKYFKAQCKNLKDAEANAVSLFDAAE